ncbi:MAG TPA: polysaccharide biosynthesis/export family protein [Humisphaera sp.]|nr:polysaccharide biosynthesis/export family protein [Humisphaera sp.]
MLFSRVHKTTDGSTGSEQPCNPALARALLKACAALWLVGLAGGCETKGWMDPKEVSIRSDPLVMPILKVVDPTVDERMIEFATASDPRPEDRVTGATDYRISRDDLLSVEITDLFGPGQMSVKTTKVSESGKISLPYLGQVPAEGLTEFELEQSIAEGYRQAGLINNAQVSVNITEARGRSFEILGSGRSAIYPIPESDFRLIDALVLGGDVTSQLVDYIYIIRRNEETKTRPTTPRPPAIGRPATAPAPATAPGIDDLIPKTQAPQQGPAPIQTTSAERALNLLTEEPAGAATSNVAVQLAQLQPTSRPADQGGATPGAPFEFNAPSNSGNVRVIRIPYQALHDGDLTYNIAVRAHDVILVQPPQTGVYYIAGHVGRPGAFTLTGQKVTIKQAIMSAGMFDELAIPQRSEIIRRLRPDHEVVMRIDLDKIFSMEQPDIYLRPDDQILVGTNAVAPFLAAIRGAFRATYGFGFLYDKNFAYDNNGNSVGF